MKRHGACFFGTEDKVIRLGIILAFFLIFCSSGWAAGPASFSGTVVDPSGAVVAGATVILNNLDSGKSESGATDSAGAFSFLGLAPGRYSLMITASGFKPYEQESLALTATDALKLDVTLKLESSSTTVEVSTQSLYIDLSSTQMGETIASSKMESVPLNGRSFTDVLALQPGVVPASSAQPNAVVMSGCTSTPPSGDMNPGNMSVSGQRETANGFSVNGSMVEEDFNNGTAVVPNLDSIQDLRVLTGDFDAEYGNFSGGQVILATKSGTQRRSTAAASSSCATPRSTRATISPPGALNTTAISMAGRWAARFARTKRTSSSTIRERT